MRTFLRERFATVLASLFSLVLIASVIQVSGGTPGLDQAVFAESRGVISTSSTSDSVKEFDATTLRRQMNQQYDAGEGTAPFADKTSVELLNQLGYSAETIWRLGIMIIPYDGLIDKQCSGESSIQISGLAIKPAALYPKCDDGRPVIPASYQHPEKCAVHYDASRLAGGEDARGASVAVLAHEIGHCMYFIYGEQQGMDESYMRIRPQVANQQNVLKELIADDFMICRHHEDTNWGIDSYYERYSINEPSTQQCGELNVLFNQYYPI